ncbi:hypothetical protein G6031_04270 [Dietzia sp. CQ4]|uniref:protein DpdD n=1 Tax=Dietzia sp. (strain CQ4) TaxID=370437 RepID=UPI0015FE37A5|nr:protein DpdD [Dietzia sp. CQ4]MBB1033604.1 hypothetical protein [Dietzia sp. CQ4]
MDDDVFFGTGNDIKPATLPAGYLASIDSWKDAIRNGQVGFLPRAIDGKLYWYGFASSPRQRKELLKLLDAWVGPTFSDLPRSRGRLHPGDPFDKMFEKDDVPPLRFEVLPRGNGMARDETREALRTLSGLLWDRPRSEFDSPRTTVEILDDLGHAISVGDGTVAFDCLRELESYVDLDYSNLAFLRLRVHAALGDTDAVFADQDLEHVLLMRRPLGVTRLLQNAVYERYLASADSTEDGESVLRAAEQIPAGLRTLTSGGASRTHESLVVEFMFALLRGAPGSTLERLIEQAQALSPELAERLRTLIPSDSTSADTEPTSTSTEPVRSTTDEIHRLIMEGEFDSAIACGLVESPSAEVAALLLACLREVENSHLVADVADFIEKSGLRAETSNHDAVVRSDLEWLKNYMSPQRSLGWHGWFQALRSNDSANMHVDFGTAAEWHPLDAPSVAECLSTLDEDALARFGDHGGAFMAAHSSLFAGEGGPELCERVLACFAVSQKNTSGIRLQTVALLEYLAASDAGQNLVTSALLWTEDVVHAATSAVTASWTVDVLQVATASPRAFALEAKTQLFYRALDVLRPVRSSLSLADIEGLRLIAEELEIHLPAEFDAVGDDPATPYRHLEGCVVALYSLTESAIIRAAQVLRRLVPGLDVRTTSDHVGSKQLASLSSNADVFVVVAASAKHAATEYIRDHRGGLPMILVNSRGSSAILRELAEG